MEEKGTVIMARLPKYVSGTTIYHVGGVIGTVTVPTTGWTGSAAPYTIALTVTGLTQGEDVLLQLDCPTDYTQAQAAMNEYNKLYTWSVTADDTLTLYASAVPASAFNLKVW